MPAGGPGRHGGVRGAWERAQLTALWCAMRARLAISAWGARLTAGQLNPCRHVLPVLHVRGPAAPPCTLACTLNPMGEQPGVGPAPAVGSGAAGLHRTRRSEAAAPCIWLNGFTSHTCGMALAAGCQQLACGARLNVCVRVGQRLCLGWYAAAWAGDKNASAIKRWAQERLVERARGLGLTTAQPRRRGLWCALLVSRWWPALLCMRGAGGSSAAPAQFSAPACVALQVMLAWR